MKTTKRIAALLLTLCLLIGMPMSVSAEGTTTEDLAVVKVETADYTTSTNKDHKIAFKFNKEITSTSGTNTNRLDVTNTKYFIGIYHKDGETPYGYDWDTTTGTCTAVYDDAASGTKQTSWSLDDVRQPGASEVATYTTDEGLGALGNAANDDTFLKMSSVYAKVAAMDPNARFVLLIKEKTIDTKDGIIDGVVATDDTKLEATHTNHEGVDAYEFVISEHNNVITSVEAYDGRLVFRFAKPVVYNALEQVFIYLQVCNASGEVVTNYYDSIKGGAASIFGNPRFAGAGSTALALDFSKFDDLKSALDANPDYTVRLTLKINTAQETETAAKQDGFLTYGLGNAGYPLMANTTMDGVDAFSTEVDVRDTADELIMEDAKFYQDNQILITFNKPVTIDTTKQYNFYVYLNASRTDATVQRYTLNEEDGTYTIDGTTGTKCEWACATSLESFGAAGNQVLATLQGEEMVKTIKAITDGSGKYLVVKIQETKNEIPHVVESVWETGNSNNKLLCTMNNDTMDRAFCEISGSISGEAMINGTCYETLAAAWTEAKENDTVMMLTDVAADMVKVPAGVTLDLNGNDLDTDILMGFGYVIDSTQGEGKLIISKNETKGMLQLQSKNPALPLYDTDGYRFYTYTLEGKQVTDHEDAVDGETNVYKMRLVFTDAKAYTLLASDDNTDLKIGVNLLIDKGDGMSNDFTYKFKQTTLEKLTSSTAALKLTVSGIGSLGESATLTATGIVYSINTGIDQSCTMPETTTSVSE